MGTLTSSQKEEMDIGADDWGTAIEEQEPVMEEDSVEEEIGEENELAVSSEAELEEEILLAEDENTQQEKPAELKGDDAVDGTNQETEEPVQPVRGDLTQRTPGMEPQVHESKVMGVQTQAGDTEDTEVETTRED